jgi:hypothetical protein
MAHEIVDKAGGWSVDTIIQTKNKHLTPVKFFWQETLKLTHSAFIGRRNVYYAAVVMCTPKH